MMISNEQSIKIEEIFSEKLIYKKKEMNLFFLFYNRIDTNSK